MIRSTRPEFVLPLFLVILLSGARQAGADAVVVSNRGERRPVKGPQAEVIVKAVDAALAIAERNNLFAGGHATESMEYLRDHEVVVEVKFDKVRQVRYGTKLQRMEYAFVPLTTEAGLDGDMATVFGGVVLDTKGVPQLINGPDRFGVIYLFLAMAPHSLSPLRAAVAQLGIDVPRPTPYPTHNGTPEIHEMPTPDPSLD